MTTLEKDILRQMDLFVEELESSLNKKVNDVISDKSDRLSNFYDDLMPDKANVKDIDIKALARALSSELERLGFVKDCPTCNLSKRYNHHCGSNYARYE